MKDLHAFAPVNKAAALAVSSGIHYNTDKNNCPLDSDFPILTRPLTKAELSDPGFIDYTGVKFGRFTVLGLIREGKCRWAVRCSCGRYSSRSTRAVKNPKNTQDRCSQCEHLLYLRRTEQYRRYGRNFDIADY